MQNVPAGAQTTLAFRVEQSKIPDFWEQKAKDKVTAIVFIRMIDDLARSNNWNVTTTYANPPRLALCWTGQRHNSLGPT